MMVERKGKKSRGEDERERKSRFSECGEARGDGVLTWEGKENKY